MKKNDTKPMIDNESFNEITTFHVRQGEMATRSDFLLTPNLEAQAQ